MLRLLCLQILLGVCVLQITSILMYKYDVVFESDEIFSPCDDYPENSIENFADISGLHIILNEDGSLDVQGELKVKHDFKKTQYKGFVEIYKRERGTWQKTVYSVIRKDFCHAVFGLNELWTPYITQVPVEMRKCPLMKGLTYDVSVTTKGPIEFPDRNLAGEYNLHIEAGDRDDDEFFCINIYANLYRL